MAQILEQFAGNNRSHDVVPGTGLTYAASGNGRKEHLSRTALQVLFRVWGEAAELLV